MLFAVEDQLSEYRQRIEALFKSHPDHDLFGSLPGAGLAINTCVTPSICFANKVLLVAPGPRSTTKPTALKTTPTPDRYVASDNVGLKSSTSCGWSEKPTTQSYTTVIKLNTVPGSSDSKKLNRKTGAARLDALSPPRRVRAEGLLLSLSESTR
jgi:hypothetical protein